MVLISKYDKKVWESYISNFQKTILLPHNTNSSNLKNKNIYKNVKSSSFSSLSKKKGSKPEVVLDLHGHSLYSAKLTLNKYIVNCYEKNIRNVLIITGKGHNNKGVLKEELPKWLSEKFFNKFLVNHKIAPKHLGGEGALLIRIKNKFKNLNF